MLATAVGRITVAKPHTYYFESSLMQALRIDLQGPYKCVTLLHRYWQGAVPGFLAVPFSDSGHLTKVGIILVRIHVLRGRRMVLITGLVDPKIALIIAGDLSKRVYGPIPILANPHPFNPVRIRGSSVYRSFENLADPGELAEWRELQIE